MNPRVEEQITGIEYNRVMHRIRNTTDQNEKIQLESVARWLSGKLDSYRRMNDTRVQTNEKEDSTRGVSNMRSMRWQNNESR